MSSDLLVITGATGFVGTHLARIAAASGLRVWAVGRDAEAPAGLAPHVERYESADLTQGWPLPGVQPRAVIHLAGLAAVGPSFARPQQYLAANSAMMTHMAESLLAEDSPARVVVVSSGAVYAPTAQGSISEASPVVPTSPYAVAKILVETQADYYRGRGLDTVIARPFNHIGPGQGLGFLVPDLTTSLRSLGPGEPLTVGNLDTARDYTDVRDVARAHLALALADGHRDSVYNIASGRSLTGRELLDAIAGALGRPVPPLVVDSGRLRPGDPAVVTGSAERLASEFSWAPTIDVHESVRAFVAGSAGD